MILENWSGPRRVTPDHAAIPAVDDWMLEDYRDLQADHERVVELKGPPIAAEPQSDARWLAVWRSRRLPGGGFERGSELGSKGV